MRSRPQKKLFCQKIENFKILRDYLFYRSETKLAIKISEREKKYKFGKASGNLAKKLNGI